MEGPCAGPSQAATDAIVAEVARRMDVSEADLRGRSRTPAVAAARHAAFWALNRAGLNPAQIARLLGLNHSSVVHGLQRAERHPDWQAAVLPAVELAGVGGERAALHRWLERGLRGTAAHERRAVHAYAACTLLGWGHEPPALCAYGLMLVLGKSRVREALEEALRRCDQGDQVYRIELHHRRLVS